MRFRLKELPLLMARTEHLQKKSHLMEKKLKILFMEIQKKHQLLNGLMTHKH